jgi:hypothetical protein
MNRTPTQRLVSHKLKVAGKIGRAAARKATNNARKPGYNARLALRQRPAKQAAAAKRRDLVKGMLARTK